MTADAPESPDSSPERHAQRGATHLAHGQRRRGKLAHDLYAAYADRYDLPIFDRIAAAETTHLDAVRTLMIRYGIADPNANQPPGRFTTPAVQANDDQLLAKGTGSQDAAPDVQRVYGHLLIASRHHLTAFDGWLNR